ncbi:hypothetical protein RJZ56_005809 [Blastomyces dermatitidis]
MVFDPTLPKTYGNFLRIKTRDLSAQELRPYSLWLKESVEEDIARFENVEDILTEKWNLLIDYTSFIDKKGLKITEGEFEVVKELIQQLQIIAAEAAVKLSTLTGLQTGQRDTNITPTVLESLQTDVNLREKLCGQYQENRTGLREEFMKYQKDRREELEQREREREEFALDDDTRSTKRLKP